MRNSEQDGVTSTGVEIVPSVPTIPFVINPVEFIFFIMKMDKDSVFVDVSSCMLLIEHLKVHRMLFFTVRPVPILQKICLLVFVCMLHQAVLFQEVTNVK